MVTARLLEGQIHEGKMGLVEVDESWLRRVHERRGRAHGERDDRRAAGAGAGVAPELAVRRLPVPRSGALVIERLIRALPLAGGAGLLPHLVPARVDSGAKRAGEGGEGAHHARLSLTTRRRAARAWPGSRPWS